MDFFERLFHMAPDGGDGTLEALYIAIAAMVVAAIGLRRRLPGTFRRALEAVGRLPRHHRPDR